MLYSEERIYQCWGRVDSGPFHLSTFILQRDDEVRIDRGSTPLALSPSSPTTADGKYVAVYVPAMNPVSRA